jgi:hypothetical protein
MNRNVVVGQWLIVDSDAWNREALDLVGPAHITFDDQGQGEMQLIAMDASIDYRVSRVDDREATAVVEFTWAGFDEGDPVSGRVWAQVTFDTMRGMLFIHDGDESSFTAERDRTDQPTAPPPAHSAESAAPSTPSP